MSAGAPPADPATEKRRLRSGARRAAARIAPRERERRSLDVQARLESVLRVREAQRLAVYAPLADEVSLEPWLTALRARGRRLAYPRIQGAGLALFWVGSAGELSAGARGLLEP